MKANDVKKELKDAGFNPKDFKVSIKFESDTRIHVTIKNPYVNRIEVEKVLKHHKRVDYDAITYEILSGGNIFLNVAYECDIFKEPSKHWYNIALLIMEDESRNEFKVMDGLHFINNELHQLNKNGRCRREICSIEQLSECLFKYMTFGSINI